MPRPGTEITISDAAVIGGAILDTGQAFFVGTCARGPVDTYVVTHSLRDYERECGDRSGGALLYDAASAFYAEGGGTLYVSRATGPAADTASGAFGTQDVDAASPGSWANDVSVTAEAPSTKSERIAAAPRAGSIVVVVAEGGVNVERSQPIASVDELVAWSQTSDYVRVSKVDNVLPAVAVTVTLAGGADDNAVDDVAIAAALARFDYALGPGQVAAPGLTLGGTHDELLAHCNATVRCALLDLPDSSDETELAAAVQALYGVAGVRFAGAFAPWAEYPGPASVAIVVPYSAVQAGLIARADVQGNPNAPAAGVNGVSRLATGLSQVFDDDTREALNDAGVNMAKLVYGDVRTYGYRTAAGPDDTNWLWFGNSRVIMAIAHESDALAENYVLRQIDGRGQLFAALETDLRGMLLAYYNAGALFGETPQDAFDVDTSSAVNTIETIAAGEVHATIRVKCSPAAEWVRIDVVKVPVERALVAA
jgi:hypothetical protein